MTNLPIACTLTANELSTRRDGLLSELAHRAEDHESLPEGLRLRFAPSGETLALLVQVIEAERQCCRFFRFQIIVEPDGGPMFLEITGPVGTGEFMAVLLATGTKP